jgi:hypothetical protein
VFAAAAGVASAADADVASYAFSAAFSGVLSFFF